MTRLVLIAALVVLILLYMNRSRVKATAYNVRSSLQNPVLRTQLLRKIFFALGRLARLGIFKRIFRP